MQKNLKNSSSNRISHLIRPHRAHLTNYIENLERLNKSTHTIKSYQNDLLQFLEWLQFARRLKLHEVGQQAIADYLNFLGQGGEFTIPPSILSRVRGFFRKIFRSTKNEITLPPKNIIRSRALGINSKKRHLSALKNFFEYLKQTHEEKGRKFKFNPVKTKIHAIKLKDTDINHTKILKQKDWEKVQESIYRVEDKLLVGLLYWAGMRLSEVRNLQISNFDFETKTIVFSRKGGYLHTLYPQNSNKVFELLDLHLSKSRINQGPVFQRKNGNHYDLKSIYNKVIKICRKSGVEDGITPHSFRKACATYLYFQTKDLLFVRDYLNHHDAKITQTYIDSKLLQSGNAPTEEMRLTVDFPVNSTYAEEQSSHKVLN